MNTILSTIYIASASFLSAFLIINGMVYRNFRIMNANLREVDETIKTVKRIRKHLGKK